jgi:hypothetical protein
MNINQLYHDHQILLMRACRAGPGAKRDVHQSGARAVAARIGLEQRRIGAAAAAQWERLSAPVAAICAAAKGVTA